MSIRPIDIQTLLMQMSQVGRDQAVEKEGAALTASIKGAEEQKKRDEAKEAIHRPEDEETGAQPVRDRQEGQGGSGAAGAGAERREGESAAPPPEGEVVRDPNLGKHVDLSG